MDLFDLLSKFIEFVFRFIKSSYLIILLFFLILIYNVSTFLLEDLKSIKTFKKYKDPELVSVQNLKSTPLVNIIVPAWKEGETFKKCLASIKNLVYPKLKIIVNAGGNKETLEIANLYKNDKNFVILYQEEGASRASMGKIKALNECLEHVFEGIIYFIDADSYLNDEILLRMIIPLINLNENLVVGGVRPLESQSKKSLVQYLLIDRFKQSKFKFSRYPKTNGITGQNFCIKYDVIKAIGKFSQGKIIATDKSMGIDILSKGYKAYQLKDYRHRIYVDYSNNLKDYSRQKIIWVENYLIYSYFFSKKRLLRFFFLFCLSIVILTTPFLFIINFNLQIIGFLLIFQIYLTKIRKLLFFKLTVERKYYEKFRLSFYLKLFFFIYFEAFITFIIPFHFIYFVRTLKRKRKN